MIQEHWKKTMHKCNVLMFAAGLGTRLRPHTYQHPKPAIPLFRIPLGYYLIPYIQKLRIENFIVNTFHLPEQIHQLYQKLDLSIRFSDEREFIRGSAGGLKHAEALLNKNYPILIANSDEVLFAEKEDFLTKALEQHENQKALATLIVMEHPEAGKKFGGIWTKKNSNQVIHIGKDCSEQHVKAWHFVGLQFVSGEILNFIADDSEKNIFYDLMVHYLKTKKVEIFPVSIDWYETGNIQDYLKAKEEISEKIDKKNSIYLSHFENLKKLPLSEISDLTE